MGSKLMEQMRALGVSVSYLIYDLICCLFDKQFNLDNTIHHLVSIVGLGAGLLYHKVTSIIFFTIFENLKLKRYWCCAEWIRTGYRTLDNGDV